MHPHQPPTHRPVDRKSTNDDIRARFDNDVERFSNLEAGQANTIDAAYSLQLLSEAAVATTPQARTIVDVGCGAGNLTLKILQHIPGCDACLIDLSPNMLERARQRVSAATTGTVETILGDIRELSLPPESCDLILAAAVLHHLRGDEEWQQTFAKFYAALRPGGSVWVFDLVDSVPPAINRLMWSRYAQFLTELKDASYQQQVFDYIAREDSPRPLVFQLNTLQQAGFEAVEILHKHGCFAAFCAVKLERPSV